MSRRNSARVFTQVAVANTAANLICQRSVNIRNTYTFKLSWEYFLLEPMDLVTLTDTGMGLTQVAVRITSIEEDDQGMLTIVAEEFPSGTATSPAYPTQTNSSNLAINPAVIPDSVNAPVIFEPDATLTGGTAQVWIAASAGAGGVADPNWGGCNVWLSADGTNYSMVGTITGPARMGVLSSTLGSFTGTNPDNSDTLAVNLNESGGTISSGTPADAAAYRTLCYCDGELLSYEAATLTGTGLYNLTTLYRGLYGTTPSAHAAGSQFARLDGAIFEYDLSEDYVGVPITVKLQSFNIWGGGVQDLSTCTAYTYTPVGIRGGLSYGQLHHESGVVFGEAMVDAYKLEKEIAVNPRIVISERVIAKLGYALPGNMKDILLPGTDSTWHLNYFSAMMRQATLEPNGADKGIRWKAAHLELINREIGELRCSTAPSALRRAEKWEWFKQQFEAATHEICQLS